MDDEFSLRPIGFRIHPPDQTIAPKFRKNEIAIFSFVSPNINLHSVIKIKEPLQSLALERARVWPRGLGREKIEFGLRERPTQRCLGQNQTNQSSRVRCWRLHTPGRKPEILWLLARWLPRFGRAFVRRQSWERLFRKTLGKYQRTIAKTQAG